ncbi:MAG: dTDP-4-amino-4,6-dideoxygalactose transaminase [Acidobacteriota bacterium]
MENSKIPFNKPFIIGEELSNIRKAVDSGHLAGDGMFSEKCKNWMEQKFSAFKVMLTDSCSSALEISAILCDITPGDEVILPSYTFVSTANAFVLRGARLKFIDIRPDTLNLDESLIEQEITDKTRVIVPVHYGGISCEMDTIMALAEKHGLLVVEDAAQGVNARYKGKYLGTIGHLGAYSFHETKNYICGEGGALVINDPRFVERAEIIREKGTNRSKFFRGEVDKYTWVDIGSSYLPPELTTAFLYAQLQEADKIDKKRRSIWKTYYQGLKPLEDEGLLKLPSIPEECENNAHMFYLVLSTNKERDTLIDFLGEHGIHAVFHYIPLHTSPMGIKLSDTIPELPVTESIAPRLLRLPCFYELSPAQIKRIINRIYTFFRMEDKES